MAGLTVKGTPMNRRPPANRILLAVGALAFVIGLVLGKDQGDAETTSNTISAVLLTQGFLMVVALVDGTAHDRDRAFTRPIVHVFRVVEHQLEEEEAIAGVDRSPQGGNPLLADIPPGVSS